MSTVLSIESDVGPLEREWEQLAERSGASPFHRPGWMRAWSSAFGNGNLRLLALRRSGELSALLPLQVGRGRLKSPTNWHTPTFGPIADRPEDVNELLAGLFDLEARSIDLSLLELEDGTLDLALEAARGARRVVAARPLTRSPWVPLEGSWEDYERRLSKNRRKGLRQRRRKLEELGNVTVEIEMGDSRLDELLEQALVLEASGWKGRRGTAIGSRPETRSFYTQVARWAAERGWLRLAFLRLDGAPIAFDLSLERGPVRYSLKAGHALAYARYGPGVLLLYELLKDAHAAGLERFELLGHEDDFKLGWTDRVSDRAWLRACAPTASGRAEATIVRARERVRPVAARLRDRISP